LGCLEIIYRSLECHDNLGLCQLVQAVGNLVEAPYSACMLSSHDPESEAERIMMVDANFPQGWLEHYTQRRFHLIDPIIAENASRFGLQYWNDTYLKAPPPRFFLLEAEDAGMKHGYSYGFQERARRMTSLFSFAGPRVARDPRTVLILERILPHLHRVLCQLDTGVYPALPPETLSARELEVLKWVSVGKSSWETGMILRIAERTVNYHVKNIMLKLDAVNRSQAVAKAVRLGLLERV